MRLRSLESMVGILCNELDGMRSYPLPQPLGCPFLPSIWPLAISLFFKVIMVVSFFVMFLWDGFAYKVDVIEAVDENSSESNKPL